MSLTRLSFLKRLGLGIIAAPFVGRAAVSTKSGATTPNDPVKWDQSLRTHDHDWHMCLKWEKKPDLYDHYMLCHEGVTIPNTNPVQYVVQMECGDTKEPVTVWRHDCDMRYFVLGVRHDGMTEPIPFSVSVEMVTDSDR